MFIFHIFTCCYCEPIVLWTLLRLRSRGKQASHAFWMYVHLKNCDNKRIWIWIWRGQKPPCVLCSEVLAQESMKLSKLKRHLETKHPSLKDKPVEYFRRRLQDLRTSQKCFTSSCSKQEQALRASYQVARRIVKLKKPYTIAEDLILPAAMDMVREVLDQSAADKRMRKPRFGSRLVIKGWWWVPKPDQLRTTDL